MSGEFDPATGKVLHQCAVDEPIPAAHPLQGLVSRRRLIFAAVPILGRSTSTICSGRLANPERGCRFTGYPYRSDGAHRGLAPSCGARALLPAAIRGGGGAGRSIPRASGADSPPRRSPAAAKPFFYLGSASPCCQAASCFCIRRNWPAVPLLCAGILEGHQNVPIHVSLRADARAAAPIRRKRCPGLLQTISSRA